MARNARCFKVEIAHILLPFKFCSLAFLSRDLSFLCDVMFSPRFGGIKGGTSSPSPAAGPQFAQEPFIPRHPNNAAGRGFGDIRRDREIRRRKHRAIISRFAISCLEETWLQPER